MEVLELGDNIQVAADHAEEVSSQEAAFATIHCLHMVAMIVKNLDLLLKQLNATYKIVQVSNTTLYKLAEYNLSFFQKSLASLKIIEFSTWLLT